MIRELSPEKQARLDTLLAQVREVLAGETDPKVRLQALHMANARLGLDDDLARIGRRYGSR